MSTPILPFAVWASGTNENSIPANDNSLRHEILNGLVIADDVTAQPGSPARGDIYIIPAGATGAQWATFDPDDIAIFDGAGTWHAYAPVDGIVLNLAGSLIAFVGSAGYISVGGGGGGSPGGPTNAVQYNAGSAFGGEAAFAYDASTNTLTVDNATLAGLLLTAASATGGAGLRVPHGTAPTSPTNGDLWTTTAGLYVRINGATVGPLAAGGALTNFTEAVNTSPPNATVPVVSLAATNAATNVDVAIVPKGTGAFALDVADNTATGGNKRGANAVDLQSTRSAAANVASGANSVAIGSSNTANSTGAVAIGSSSSATGTNSVALGASNTASGNGAVAVGSSSIAGGTNALASAGGTASSDYALCHGPNCTADGQYSLATGRYATTRGVYGSSARTAFLLAAQGDAQTQEFQLMSDTTSAASEPMSTNNATAATSNQVLLPNASAYIVTGDVVASENATGDCKEWTFRALIKRGANAAATALVGSPTVTSAFADAGASAWALAITANTTLGTLAVGITGEASKNIKWSAHVRAVQVVG